MEITDIRIRRMNSEGKMKAVVSVTFDDALVVHDIKVIEGQDKIFIAMPSRKTPDGDFRDITHPINSAMREKLQSSIIAAYEESCQQTASETSREDEAAPETSFEDAATEAQPE
jgi:stage V sporulation protein G